MRSLLLAMSIGLSAAVPQNFTAYLDARDALEARQRALRFDATARNYPVMRTPTAAAANATLIAMRDVLRAADPLLAANGTGFLPALPFRGAKAAIEKTRLFKALSAMPKGAVLHLHWDSILPVRWLVEHASYREHCYVFQQGADNPAEGSLQFFASDAAAANASAFWRGCAAARAAAGSATIFDDWLEAQLDVMATVGATGPDWSASPWASFNVRDWAAFVVGQWQGAWCG